jgi:hypothetical protein
LVRRVFRRTDTTNDGNDNAHSAVDHHPGQRKTSIGTLRLLDGLPDEATVQTAYDNLDRRRGVDVFLNTMPAASTNAIREVLRSPGVDK